MLQECDYNVGVEALREKEYPMLQDSVYLDHAGTTLCCKSMMDAFSSEMTSTLYGNPHSSSSPSQLSTSRIEDIRLNLLTFFGADPEEYDLVFVANATAGVKLVVDAMRSQPRGWRYAYHEACHTSLIGAREEADMSICLDDASLQRWINGVDPFAGSPNAASATLVSYSAQSNMDGKRYPLSWTKDLKDGNHTTTSRVYTMLDAASISATSPLNLGDPVIAPDFAVFSLYKIFGFPDLGALVVRRSAEGVFDHRKYFGGGTVDMVVCGKEAWHASKAHSLHERLEDGTLPFHSIIAVGIAIGVHTRLYGSMGRIRAHTTYLTQNLLHELAQLQHANGEPVCIIYTNYSENEATDTGPVVSFNLKSSRGTWVSLTEFEKLAILKKMHVRTGGLCSPGSIASALHLQPWEMSRNFSAGFRCGNDIDIVSGKPTGVIRASLGAMSTKSDVQRFVAFIQEFFQENELPNVDTVMPAARLTCSTASLRVKAITIYPIKSCGGFSIPEKTAWDVRPEGLAWDREWCLVHQGSGRALSQKRYPNMALLQPSLDFEKGLLRVANRGTRSQDGLDEVTVPLSFDPSFLDAGYRQMSSQVCGDSISAQRYTSDTINRFFSGVLGVPCVLARFPPGGRGLASRLSKAQMQKHQQTQPVQTLPGSFPDLPSPPDSDSEQQLPARILLSNESPILMIHSSSVDALNREIVHRGGTPVDSRSFRANVILESPLGMKQQPAYSEDIWKSIRIGQQGFTLLGACRRCQMLCIDQETGAKKEEPFVTLAKTRKFDGKVFFGAHMRLDHSGRGDAQCPTIQVGDLTLVDSVD